jgi:hydroxypyruvate reductase
MLAKPPREFLEELFRVAVAAAQPKLAMQAWLPARPKGRTVVVGAGKAASQMAQSLETLWDGDLSGVVVAKHGPVAPCMRIDVLQAAHPVPDEAGLAGSKALFATVAGLTEDDLVIALISGGGSSLLPAPAGNLTLADEIATNRALLASGAPISAMNIVRRHISRIKGGQLAAAAHPARVVTLVVSDVPGDDPALVASGPTIADSSSPADALDLLKYYQIDLPPNVLEHLRAAAAANPLPPRVVGESRIIASARVSLDAAAAAARAAGIEPIILSDAIEGEAREIAKMHAALAIEISERGKKPVLLLSGGETTVTLPPDANGRGGRNSEFLLSFAIAIEGRAGIYALAADTDGIDGSEPNAGAYADGETIRKLREAGLAARELQAAHDSYSAFSTIDALIVTGPTGTNINDFRAVLIL